MNSAYYDPKTRSMRDNPNKERDPKDLDYAGDNFIRYTGESQKMMEMQRFCWDANDKGVEISMQANPTQAELMNQGFREKKDDLKEKTKQTILEKYGGGRAPGGPSQGAPVLADGEVRGILADRAACQGPGAAVSQIPLRRGWWVTFYTYFVLGRLSGSQLASCLSSLSHESHLRVGIVLGGRAVGLCLLSPVHQELVLHRPGWN